MKLLLASQNQHKKEEIFQIFKGHDIELIDLSYFNDQDDPVEDGITFLDNALIKARYFAKKYQMPTISDDSGICVIALDGRPGVHSKRYSGGTDEDNNNKLLEELKDKDNRAAYYVSVIAIVFPDGKTFHYEGRLYGEIAFERKGTNGFGYDPLFYLPEYDKHVAQLSMAEKNKISHRANALKQVGEHLDEIINYK